MKLAIMQPYLFPYVGYFSLVAQADKFVFYDDVNFIKNGWINRNRLYLSGDIRYFTIPLFGASSNLKINQIEIQPKIVWQRKLIDSIKQSYSKAPYFKQTFELLEDILNIESDNVADYAKRSIMRTAELLSFDTKFIESSTMYNNQHLNSVSRVVDICLQEEACEYLNLSGGKSLYDEQDFSNHGIKLEFIENKFNAYKQFNHEFMMGLSILDVLMFNSLHDAKKIIVG